MYSKYSVLCTRVADPSLNKNCPKGSNHSTTMDPETSTSLFHSFSHTLSPLHPLSLLCGVPLLISRSPHPPSLISSPLLSLPHLSKTPDSYCDCCAPAGLLHCLSHPPSLSSNIRLPPRRASCTPVLIINCIRATETDGSLPLDRTPLGQDLQRFHPTSKGLAVLSLLPDVIQRPRPVDSLLSFVFLFHRPIKSILAVILSTGHEVVKILLAVPRKRPILLRI